MDVHWFTLGSCLFRPSRIAYIGACFQTSFLRLLHRRADLAMVPFKQVPMTLTLARRSSCVKAFFSRSCHATSKSAALQWIFPKKIEQALFGGCLLIYNDQRQWKFLDQYTTRGGMTSTQNPKAGIFCFSSRTFAISWMLHLITHTSPNQPAWWPTHHCSAVRRRPECGERCPENGSQSNRRDVESTGGYGHVKTKATNQPGGFTGPQFACGRSVLSMKSHKAKQRHKSQKWFTLIVHCLEIAVGSVMFDAVTLAILRPWTSKVANQSGKFEKSETGNSVR